MALAAGSLDPGHVFFKASEPVHHSLPFRQGSVHIHKIGKRILDSAKSRSYLQQSPQGQFPTQEPGNGHHKGKDDGDLGIAGIQPHQLFLFQDDLPEVLQQQGKAFLEYLSLQLFSLVKGNTFRIFPHPHHTEPEIRFPALLEKIQGHQLMAYPVSQPSAHRSISHGHPDHISREVPGASQKGKGKRPGELPKDHHKRYQGA